MDEMPEYLSERLFHFWGLGMSDDQMFEVLESIADNGLLCTTGNQDSIGEFRFFSFQDGEERRVRLRQWARVCFTEVPSDKLTIIRQRFGSFGIGFPRRTILHWGGCPVWYIPNSYRSDTQYGRFPVALNSLRELADLVESMKQKGTILTLGTADLTKDASFALLDRFKGVLFFLASHFKEMSPLEGDDHSFLYEREWRLVFGLHYGPGGTLYRELTNNEKNDLIRRIPRWAENYKTGNEDIDSQFRPQRMVDDFRFFNGIQGGATVLSSIAEVLVPREDLRQRVGDLLATRLGGADNMPEIRVQ